MRMKPTDASNTGRKKCMARLSIGFIALFLVWSLSPALWSMEPSMAPLDSTSTFPTGSQGSTTKSVGPIQVYSADSSVIMRIQFAGQLRMDWKSTDRGSDSDREHMYFMQARRVRPSVTIKLPEERMVFRLHLSTAPGSLELMDLHFDYHFHRHVQFRVGQYKIPFTRYRIQSFQRLTFVDWAIVTKYFGAERQMGFSFHNGYEQPPRLAYEFGVFGGTNARESHAVGLSKVYGEDTVIPSDLAGHGPRGKFHPEVVARFSYNPGGIRVRSDSDEQRGGLRYSLGFNLAWDMEPVVYHDLVLRAATEMLVKHRGASFMAAGYTGWAEIGESSTTQQAMTGLLIQTALRFSQRYELSMRFAMVDIDETVTDAALARAQGLITNAEGRLADEIISQAEVDELIAQYQNAGRIRKEQELTVGFNLYVLGHSLKWQSDVGWLRYSMRVGSARDDIILRSQFQIAY